MKSISVIIPSYNDSKKIYNCVNSLLNQSVSNPVEILIVDSSNKEYQKKVEKLSSLDSRIKIIKLDRQTFPGAARNIGIDHSKGEIIVLIDSDCEADQHWLQNISNHIDDNTVITGIIKNGTKKSILGTCSYLVEFNNFLEFNHGKKRVKTAATCNFAAKRMVFEKVGGFAESRAFEDSLFCHKLISIGGKICQYDDIIISHNNKTKFKNISANQKMLGKYSAIVRLENNMSPKAIFRFPILSFLLPLYRYFSIATRVIKTSHIFQFILYTPLIIYLLIVWAVGFYQGIFTYRAR
mgnify:FL=1